MRTSTSTAASVHSSDPDPSAAANTVAEAKNNSNAGISLDTPAVVASSSTQQKARRARGRWKLLQQAICSSIRTKSYGDASSTNDHDDDDDAQQYSKRRFPGYGMLKSREWVEEEEISSGDSAIMIADWKANLARIETTTTSLSRNLPRSVEAVRQEIECSVLAMWALCGRNHHQEGAVAIHLWMDSDPQIYLGNKHDSNNDNNDTRSNTTPKNAWLDTLPALRNMVGSVSLAVSEEEEEEEVDGETQPSKANQTWSKRRWRLTFSITDQPTTEEEKKKMNHRKPPQYGVRQYQLPGRDSDSDSNDNQNEEFCILTRERQVSVHTKLSLQELVSHRQNRNENEINGSSSTPGGVDNTGNICVWDCALTLAWALQQQPQGQLATRSNIRTVLELGGGMAAIGALSLAVTLPAPTRIHITDGHADCVLNNRVNVRLMQAAGILPDGDSDREIDCCQLLWTTEALDSTAPESQIQAGAADLTLIADCTHFQEYHAALFWTAVQHTATGGQIWMCQPDRGDSLERFLTLTRVVNENNHNNLLLRVTEQHYPELDDRHEQFLHNNNHYDPNLHRPRILVLAKERAATEQDRQCALQHMRERDHPKTS